MPFYALVARSSRVTPTESDLPLGATYVVDLSPTGASNRVFVESDVPFVVAGDVLASFGSGATLDQHTLNGRERNSWNSLLGTAHPNGLTLLEILWRTLTVDADPTGIARAKPIMPTRRGELELRVNGQVLRSEKLPDDPTTHVAWSNIQAVLQNDYRQNWNAEGETKTRQWLGNEQDRFRLTPERTRDLIVPSDLPSVLPLRPTTTVGDTFVDTNLTLLEDHTATGPDGGHSWEALVSGSRITASNTASIRGGCKTRTGSDGALSSADHYVQGKMLDTTGFTWRGPAARFSASANTCYQAQFDITTGRVTLHRIEAGTVTEITRFTQTYVQNDVIKLVCDGSTISVEVNDIEVISVTNTAITGHLRTGFNEQIGSGAHAEFDDFEASDLAAGSEDALTADDLSSGTPTLDTPTLGQEHSLTASDLSTGSPTLDTPALTQVHTLAASDLATGTPILGTPTLGVSHVLTANNLTSGTPELDSPALGQVHVLTATDLATTVPLLDSPTLTQEHVLTANGLSTSAPTLDTPVLTQEHQLTADALTSGTPTLDTPTLGTSHVLAANDLTVGTPTLDSPTLAQVHILTADDLFTGSPILGTPLLGQVHVLTADDLATGLPLLGTPSLSQAGDFVTSIRIVEVLAENRSVTVLAEDRIAEADTELRIVYPLTENRLASA